MPLISFLPVAAADTTVATQLTLAPLHVAVAAGLFTATFSAVTPARGIRLLDGVELDPVEQGVVLDWAGMSGAATQGLTVGFAAAGQVLVVHRDEWHEFDGIDLDVSGADSIAATHLHVGGARAGR